MKLKITSILLAILLLIVPLFSCANPENDGSDTPADTTTADPAVSDSDGTDTTVTEPITTSNDVLTVPDDLTFENKTITIYTWSNQTQWEWDAQGDTGSLLDQAIYDRKRDTETKLGITLAFEKENGDWDHRIAFIQKAASNIKTNMHSFDLVSQYTPAAAIGAMQELYLDLGTVNYLDLTRKWWPDDINEKSSINGKLYFTTGDITPTLIRNMGTVMANLTMAKSYNLPDLYELVDSGEWTLDKMLELALGHAGSNSDADKVYGITIPNNVTYDNLFYSGGFTFVTENADGTLQLSDELSKESLVNWYDKCMKMLFDNPDVDLIAVNKAFTTGNSLFHMGQVSDVQNYLVDVNFKFAILPYPKASVKQESYHTIAGYWVSMLSIPVDAIDADMSGAVLEVLGYEGYKTITPAFYEVAFKYRYLDSEDNARMFDLLHDTMTNDTGRTFADQISCFASFRTAAKTDGSSWTVVMNANKIAWETKIQAIYDTLG